ncbi:hypothetical protein ElyMa_005004600 [Elysia marginata]|uniref:Uncharacterized protein n=1 Tax=Elysia marginata TaxID=1093978 RepID=A0AAV4JBL6_9GAST|nr:hypothetical protein ElyMa_005004600 [Elysia marginata]
MCQQSFSQEVLMCQRSVLPRGSHVPTERSPKRFSYANRGFSQDLLRTNIAFSKDLLRTNIAFSKDLLRTNRAFSKDLSRTNRASSQWALKNQQGSLPKAFTYQPSFLLGACT